MKKALGTLCQCFTFRLTLSSCLCKIKNIRVQMQNSQYIFKNMQKFSCFYHYYYYYNFLISYQTIAYFESNHVKTNQAKTIQLQNKNYINICKLNAIRLGGFCM